MDYLQINELYHHGIKGQKWGIRNYQNEDGILTKEGYLRYKQNQYDMAHPHHSILYKDYLNNKHQINNDYRADKTKLKNEYKTGKYDKATYKDKKNKLKSEHANLHDENSKRYDMTNAQISDKSTQMGLGIITGVSAVILSKIGYIAAKALYANYHELASVGALVTTRVLAGSMGATAISSLVNYARIDRGEKELAMRKKKK